MSAHSIKSLLGNSFSLFGIRLAIILAGLIGMSVYAHQLPRDVYAQYQFLLITLSIFIAVGSLGMGSVIYNFSPDGFKTFIRSSKTRSRIVYLLFILAWSALFPIVIYTQPTHSGISFSLLALFSLFSITAFSLENILLIFKSRTAQLMTNWIYGGLWLAAHFYVLQDDFDLGELVLIWTILAVLKTGVLLFILFLQFQKGSSILSDMSEIRPQKKTWQHLGFYEVFQLIVRQMDKFILTYITSAETAAVYYNGRVEIPVLPAILSSVRNAALIQLRKSSQQKDTLIQIVQNTFRLLSTIGLSVTIFGTVYSQELIVTVFSDKYLESIPIFICTLSILPAQYCISLSYILQYQERADLINKGAFLDFFLSIILLYPFYKMLGVLGIVCAVLVSTYIQSIYYLFHASKTTRVQILRFLPLKDFIIKSVIFAVVAIGFHYIGSWLFTDLFNFLLGGIVGLITVAWVARKDLKRVEV